MTLEAERVVLREVMRESSERLVARFGNFWGFLQNDFDLLGWTTACTESASLSFGVPQIWAKTPACT